MHSLDQTFAKVEYAMEAIGHAGTCLGESDIQIAKVAHSIKDVLTQLKHRNSVQRGCCAGCWEKEH